MAYSPETTGAMNAVPQTNQANFMLLGGEAEQQSGADSLSGSQTGQSWGGIYPPPVQTPCPYCGHCPHCGRGGYTPPQPYNPSYPANPIWTLTCGPVGTAQNFS